MHSSSCLTRALAAAFLAGDLVVDELVDRGGHLLGRRARWLRPLARRLVQVFGDGPRPRHARVVRFIVSDAGFRRACSKGNLVIARPLVADPEMASIAAARSWGIPSLPSPARLAEWLGTTRGELDWFADRRSLEAKRPPGRLGHYRYRVLSKRFGRLRLIEAPKPRLKAIQRRLLAELLDAVPPHDAVHGFRRGRSIQTFAAPHTGRHAVLRIDLHDFFPSIRRARVEALFRALGYPEVVADLLAGLCTNTAPPDVWSGHFRFHDAPCREARWRYAQPHLPQGAPTSPALANLCGYRMDCRLARLAAAAGAVYTRYGDDLAFSGGRDWARAADRFHLHVCATVLSEGFIVHHRKTRIMRRGVRQYLAGMVVNQRLNIPRHDFDRLKAVLTNCVRHGPQGENRDGHADFRRHLEGRMAFVETVHPVRGRRLRALFDQIQW